MNTQEPSTKPQKQSQEMPNPAKQSSVDQSINSNENKSKKPKNEKQSKPIIEDYFVKQEQAEETPVVAQDIDEIMAEQRKEHRE